MPRRPPATGGRRKTAARRGMPIERARLVARAFCKQAAALALPADGFGPVVAKKKKWSIDEDWAPLTGLGALASGTLAAGIVAPRLVPDFVREPGHLAELREEAWRDDFERQSRGDHTPSELWTQGDLGKWGEVVRRADAVARRDVLPARVRPLKEIFVGPQYHPIDEWVDLPTTRGEVAAHELGHAMNARSLRRLLGTTGGQVAHAASRVMLNFAPVTGLVPYLLGGKARKWAWLTPLLVGAPGLADEGLASLRGMAAYGKELGASPDAVGNLARAFGTYAVSAGMPALGYYLMSRLQGYDEDEDKDKGSGGSEKKKRPAPPAADG
jgi:hypothetical protein